MTNSEYAQRYAKLGWYVLPLYEINAGGKCSCGNPNCHSPGKHPRTVNGLIDASIDQLQIDLWFRQWPNANIGVRTGPESGILAIDIDGKDGELSIESRFLPPCFEAMTGGGGRHLVYAHPGSRLKSGTGILPSVDSRADGGYIVVEPSNHISGNAYEWRTAPWDDIIMSAPDWWIGLITPTDRPKTRSPLAQSDEVGEGGRNNYLTSFAGTLRRQGMDYEEILAALESRNRKKCKPPLPSDEVDQIARSIVGYSVFTPEQEAMIEKGDAAWKAIADGWKKKRLDALEHRQQTIKKVDPPKSFVPAHGLVQQIYDWIIGSSRYQLPYLAMAAAVSFVSVLIGQKWRGHTGLKPNLYMIGMAPSGGGKDYARSCIDLLATRAGLDGLIGGARIASGSALISALEDNPVQLYQLDEFGLMLQLMTDKNASGHKKELMDLMMQVYTTTGIFRGTDYADRKLRKRKPIENPVLSIYGTTTPGEFYKSLSSSSGDNGFLGRMIFIDGGEDTKDASKRACEPPIELIEAIKSFVDTGKGNLENSGHCQPESMHCPRDIDDAWNRLEDDLRAKGDDTTRPIYRRAHANIMKLSIVFSVSCGSREIDADSYSMARDIVLWSLDTIIDGMSQHVADSESERDSKRIENAIKNGGPGGVSTTELFCKTRSIKRYDRENIIADLSGAGIIKQDIITHEGAGRPAVRWVHNEFIK
jgi:hypothetical protein